MRKYLIIIATTMSLAGCQTDGTGWEDAIFTAPGRFIDKQVRACGYLDGTSGIRENLKSEDKLAIIASSVDQEQALKNVGTGGFVCLSGGITGDSVLKVEAVEIPTS